MTNLEIQKRVLRHGKPLDLNKFTWDEDKKVFTSNESGLVLLFRDVDGIKFNLGSYCDIKTGSRCIVNVGTNCKVDISYLSNVVTSHECTINTGDDCRVDTSSMCTINTGDDCSINVMRRCKVNSGHGCIINTTSYCEIETGDDCNLNTYDNCTFKTGDICTFNTRFRCTFDTGKECFFLTGAYCDFITGDVCDFEVRDNCNIKAGKKCDIDVYGFCTIETDTTSTITINDIYANNSKLSIKPLEGEIIHSILNCGYISKRVGEDGFYMTKNDSRVEYIAFDSRVAEVVSKRNNVYRVIELDSNGKVNPTTPHTYIVEENGVFSFGVSVKAAYESLIYTVTNRDKTFYTQLTLNSKLDYTESVKLYRVITGASDQGVKEFVEKLSTIKDVYSVKDIIKLTKGEYGNSDLVKFFQD